MIIFNTALDTSEYLQEYREFRSGLISDTDVPSKLTFSSVEHADNGVISLIDVQPCRDSRLRRVIELNGLMSERSGECVNVKSSMAVHELSELHAKTERKHIYPYQSEALQFYI